MSSKQTNFICILYSSFDIFICCFPAEGGYLTSMANRLLFYSDLLQICISWGDKAAYSTLYHLYELKHEISRDVQGLH